MAARPRLADGRTGAHPVALFRWGPDPVDRSVVTVADLVGCGPPLELIDRLRARPEVRALHPRDVRLGDLVGALAPRCSALGPRLRELAGAERVLAGTVRRLEALERRIAELDAMTLPEELASLCRAVCPDDGTAGLVARHLGWDGLPAEPSDETAPLVEEALRALRQARVYAPRLAALDPAERRALGPLPRLV